MSISPAGKALLAVIVLIVFAGVAGLGLAIPQSSRFVFGVMLLLIGAVNAVFYSLAGNRYFSIGSGLSSRPTSFWALLGQAGAKCLFLGIGLIFAASGALLIFIERH